MKNASVSKHAYHFHKIKIKLKTGSPEGTLISTWINSSFAPPMGHGAASGMG